ncbi:septum formation initiator family protein [Guyparkeria hydrothermalis]|uniref:FtsB family cell division protein n=1 Tax=Guyparkeria hydrothermalis TaxID=923 RepID=UPI0020216E7A|nr:septum formation initiator family protein [Guyparkeria hydrothermalis]MCL7743639.1 septum formation initiator family protein [Guyparkeria hydrothermalis]
MRQRIGGIRGLTVVLVLMLAGLQWRVWFGDASMGEISHKEARLAHLEAEQTRLERRNETLAAEVESLRQGVDAVEAQARLNLGLVRPDEHFYQVIEAVRPDTIMPPTVAPSRSSSPLTDE